MGRLPEPDDVDIFVDGGDSDPESNRETSEYIKEYKKRPEYADQVREARKILDSLEINSRDYERPDPVALLDHWKKCVEDLTREADAGTSIRDRESVGPSSNVRLEE